MAVINHPLATFLFLLSNLSSGVAFVFLLVAIVPRIRYPRGTRVAAGFMYGSAALSQTMLALTVLFRGDTTASDLADSGLGFSIQAVLALSAWSFLLGCYLYIGTWMDSMSAPTVLVTDDTINRELENQVDQEKDRRARDDAAVLETQATDEQP